MNLKTLRPLALGAAILTIGAAGAAVAQPAPGAGPMGRVHEQGMREHRGMNPEARSQHMADRLRTVLQLTPAQEPALRAFIDATKPPQGMREHRKEDRAQMAGLSTPQRLDRMQDRMDQHRAEFAKRSAATKRFYAQLTPTQQKAFDALGPRMGHEGHRGGMGHGPGRDMDDGPRG